MEKRSFDEQAERLIKAFDFSDEIVAREKEHKETMIHLLRSLVDVMDSFDRLLSTETGLAGESTSRPPSEDRGMRLISRQLRKVLEDAGVSRMSCIGELLDPQRHEVDSIRGVNQSGDEMIVEIVREGYEWKGEVLRCPRVVVAINSEEEEP
jgi:molecular chaperone GrpE (heat shock protein)